GLWRSDPWIDGNTIDLGDHEAPFQVAVGRQIDRQPPALVDWLRWQFKRWQLDDQNAGRWWQTLHHRLPEKVAHYATFTAPDSTGSSRRTIGAIEADPIEAQLNELIWQNSHELSWIWQSGLPARAQRA